MQKSTTARNTTLALIIFLGFFVRIVNLTMHDLGGDEIYNTARSMYWLDFMQSTGQTTPVQWFDEKQWWQGLSFHDHPPLGFSFQYVMMRIFSDSVFGIRFPFVILGTIVIYLMYLLGKKLFNSEKAGLFAAIATALSPSAIWVSRISLYDAFVVFFIILSWYFFLKAGEDKKYYVWWAVALAGGLLSKYTFVFILPFYFIFLAARKDFKEKKFWYGVGICLILLAPVIIYNVMVFKTRGHFDASLSSMVGMKPQDFAIIANRAGNSGFGNILRFFNVFWMSFGPSAAVFGGLGVLCSALMLLKRKNIVLGGAVLSQPAAQILAQSFVIFVFFYFLHAEQHFISIAAPLIAVSSAAFAIYAWDSAVSFLPRISKFKFAFLTAAIVILFVPAVNIKRIEKNGQKQIKFFQEYRMPSDGYNAMYKKVDDLLLGAVPSFTVHQWAYPQIREFQRNNAGLGAGFGFKAVRKNTSMILMEERIDWAAKTWLSMKYFTFHMIPAMGSVDFASILASSKKPVNFFSDAGIKDYYFFEHVKPPEKDSDRKAYEIHNALIDELKKDARFVSEETEIFKNFSGEDYLKLRVIRFS